MTLRVPRRVLVTGAGGFVGANLVRRLLAEGHEVTAVVRPRSDGWRLTGLGEALSIRPLDLTDHDGVGRVMQEVRPERVFHLAAHGAYSWQDNARRIMETNAVGAVNLLDACLDADCEAFVNAGSSSEYGLKDHPPSEDETLEPGSAYAVSKAAATLLCSHAARTGKIGGVTLRLYSVYGPYEAPRRLIPQLVVQGLRGRLPPLVAPEVAHDFVAIDDVVEAFLLAAERVDLEPGAVYNIGSGVQTGLRDVVAMARRVLGVEVEPEWGSAPGRDWDTTTWVADARKAQSMLGWRATVSFEEGFARTVAWLESTPEVSGSYGLES